MKRLFILAVALVSSIIVFAQEQHTENCPFGGVVDCKGQCGMFIDENNDGFCDNAVLSKQSDKKNVNTSKTDASDNKKISDNKNLNSVKASDKPKTESIIISKDNSESENQSANINGNTTDTLTETITKGKEFEKNLQEPTKTNFPYHIWQVLCITVGLYLITFLAVKTKKMKKITHRRIWNAVLGITFFVSCLIGLYVAFAKMYSWQMDYLCLMKWHVDFGLSMTVVAIIHCFWHLNYWKTMFKRA